MKLSIIVPAYNESLTIPDVLRAIADVPFPVDHEVIVVDDASDNRTFETVAGLTGSSKPARLLRNARNLGKGASVSRGLREAAGDIVIVQDADLELDPRDIPALIQPIVEGKAEAVYGSRFLKSRWPDKWASWMGW